MEHPDHGWLVANVTMSGLCGASYSAGPFVSYQSFWVAFFFLVQHPTLITSPGPPPEQAQALSHWLQSTLLACVFWLRASLQHTPAHT